MAASTQQAEPQAAGRTSTREYSVFQVDGESRLDFAGKANVARADMAAQVVAQQLVDQGSVEGGKLKLDVVPTRNVQRFEVEVETKPRAKLVRK